MISASSEVAPVDPFVTMLRPWLRRRRVLLVTCAITLVLVPSFLLTANMRGPYPSLNSADYDSNDDYGAIDGVHAMVHQMGRTKTKRSTDINKQQKDTGTSTDQKPRLPVIASGPRRNVGKRILHRKMQEEQEIPPEVIKGYAFLSQGSKPRVVPNSPQTVSNMNNNPGSVRHVEEEDDDYGANDDDGDIESIIIQGSDPDDDVNDDDLADGDYNEYWSRNPEFKPGDFDRPPNWTRPVLRYEDLPGTRSPSSQEPLVRNILRVRKIQYKADISNYKSDLKPMHHRKPFIKSPPTVIAQNEPKAMGDNSLRFIPLHTPDRAIHTSNCDPKLGCDPSGIHQRQSKDRIFQPRAGEIMNPHGEPAQEGAPLPQGGHPLLGSQQEHLPGNGNNGQGNQGVSKDAHLKGLLRGSTRQEILQYAYHLPLHEQPATQLQMPELPPLKGKVKSNDGFPVVMDTIYWSQHVEDFVPKGKNMEEMITFQHHLAKLKIKEMHPPQWIRCGRPKNQYVVFEDGSAACARYRHPHDKLLQGEVLSFYLSRLLGLDNVPITVLAQVNSSDPRWQLVDPQAADWEQNQLVVLIQWINGLDSEWSRVKMPAVILTAYETGRTLDSNNPVLTSMTSGELAELLQWSDMVLFDYIIGHYDRVASMQDGADREKKASIMSESIRNLRKVPQTNRLWLIDNESGLFDGYELLYQEKGSGGRFIQFHRQMLQAMCLFRKSLVRRIEELARHPHPEKFLVEFARTHEPLYDKLPKGSKHKLFRNYFHTRLKEVVRWVQACKVR